MANSRLVFKVHCRPYGYKSGDLIFFLDPGESLGNGLHLITFDHNFLFIVEQHKTYNIVHLYIVSFEEGIVDVFEEDDEAEDGVRVDLNNPWWHDKISDEEDIFDVDIDDVDEVGGGAGPSIVVRNKSECHEGEQDRNERSKEEGNETNDEGEGNEDNDWGRLLLMKMKRVTVASI
jgi:hypothetical protein